MFDALASLTRCAAHLEHRVGHLLRMCAAAGVNWWEQARRSQAGGSSAKLSAVSRVTQQLLHKSDASCHAGKRHANQPARVGGHQLGGGVNAQALVGRCLSAGVSWQVVLVFLVLLKRACLGLPDIDHTPSRHPRLP
jgi:hypothetical protein